MKKLGISGTIPTDTPGVEIGRRHLPLGAAFMNGPNWGGTTSCHWKPSSAAAT